MSVIDDYGFTHLICDHCKRIEEIPQGGPLEGLRRCLNGCPTCGGIVWSYVKMEWNWTKYDREFLRSCNIEPEPGRCLGIWKDRT